VRRFSGAVCQSLAREPGVTVGDDASDGYCLHAFVVADLDGHMVPRDQRLGVEFGLVGPNSAELLEVTLPGLWAVPDPGTMRVLQLAECLDDAMRRLPDAPSAAPIDADFVPTSAAAGSPC